MQTFTDLVQEYAMLSPGATVLCAVSGGADSMCLLHLLSRWEGITLHAAHFDHRLRGEDSARDAEFVRAWCEQAGIPFHLGSGDVARAARERGQGIEETARELRYSFLRETAASLGCDVIATAHNAGDNAETVLLHLLRGTGLKGLTGIAPRQGDLIRPLLTTPRKDIEAYLEEQGVPHVEDATNADDTYARNRVRHRLLPLMEELAPGFEGRLTDATPRLRADNDYLTGQAAQVCYQYARWAEEDLVIEAKYIASLPAALAPRAVGILLDMLGEGSDFSASHLKAVVDICRGSDPSAVVFLPHGLLAQRVYRELLLTRRQDPLPPLEPFAPKAGKNPIPGTDWTLVLEGPPWPGLTVRSRQVGDEITLPKRPKKRVKELLIDEKVPRRDRDRIPVCADDEGVLALAGFGNNTEHSGSGAVRFIKEEKEERQYE